MMGVIGITKIRDIGSLVKFSHTIFAMPFALASMIVAARGFPTLRIFALILIAMITARNAAMAFNRFIDAAIDAKNPRTTARHIPQGIFSKNFVLVFSVVNAALLILVSYFLNPLCFRLSPPALFVLYLYSLTKRFTHYSHLVLGLALGMSPMAA